MSFAQITCWTLAHKILGSCSPALGLYKSVEICGPEFISFEKVAILLWKCCISMIERKTTELCYFLLMLNLHLSTVSIITLMTVWRMTGKVI